MMPKMRLSYPSHQFGGRRTFPLRFLHLSAILIVACVLLSSCRNKKATGVWPLPQKELRSLESTLKNADAYAAKSELVADSIKRLLNKDALPVEPRLLLTQQIADYYRPRMADSALIYARRAYGLAHGTGSERLIVKAALTLTDALSASGYFSIATSLFDSISTSRPENIDRIEYWTTGRQLYSNICNYIGAHSELYDFYFNKETVFVDSLLHHLPASDNFRQFLKSESLINAGKDEEARRILMDVIQRVEMGSQIYGMTAYQIAHTYRRTDQTIYASYLAKAAESDIMGGIRDGYALPSLSEWLYHEKHFQEAFRYINFAMNDAYLGSARMRLVNISSLVPDIDEAYREEISNSLSDFAIFAIMLSVVLIFLIIGIALLLKEMKKRRMAHTQLANLSKMKDSYIRDFIGLCSAYSEKYDSLSRTVTRKITAGQAQDLLKLVKSGKASESENEEFYMTIDRVFMSLYPDFINQINNLLQPEQRYESDKNSKNLTPELRIYGFVRLGVTESAKIAKILNYSANTVYAYRNRMRNKAIDRDGFDEAVMNMDNEDSESIWGI